MSRIKSDDRTTKGVGRVFVAVTITAAGCSQSRPPVGPTTPATTSSATQRGYLEQVVLPFTGLKHPGPVAVDTKGDVYVVDDDNYRVLKLPAQ